MFFILDSSFKRFENYTVKLSAKETKWTSLEVRTHPTFLENLISKYDFGPVKLTGPVSYFEIEVLRKKGCVLTSNEVHFVSLAENFTVNFQKF